MKYPAFEPIDLRNDISVQQTLELSLTQIMPDEKQARQNFDPVALEELALSISKHGVVQPIIVKNKNSSGMYPLVAGERRWRAAKIAGLNKIPVIVRPYSKSEGMAISLIENIQRENLNPLEEAEAIHTLLQECSMTHNQIAESIGKSRASVSNLLRLLNLSDEVKDLIHGGHLEMGHARTLLSLNAAQQIEIANVIIKKTLSVRTTERLVHSLNNVSAKSSLLNDNKNSWTPKLKMQIDKWKMNLLKKWSTKVVFHITSDGNYELIMKFSSFEATKNLIRHLISNNKEDNF